MNGMSCDTITDLLPDRLVDRIGELERLAVDEHLRGCAECRAHRALLIAVRDSGAPVPAGLHERVVQAVAARPARRSWTPAHFAVAATIVFALLGGGVFLAGDGGPDRPGADGDPGVATVPASSFDDPLLHGGPGLGRLSIDELQILLAELDS